VLSAITSTQQRLKLYTKVPPNGLVLYCGTVLTEDGKERQVLCVCVCVCVYVCVCVCVCVLRIRRLQRSIDTVQTSCR